MNKEIIEYLELEIQMRKDGISTMVNSVHRDRLQKEIEKLNSWITHLANEAEQNSSNCNIPLVCGSVFMLLDEDDDVITPLYTTKSAAIKRRAEMLEQNLRERITVNEIEVNKY